MNHTLLDVSKQLIIAIVGLSFTLAATADVVKILAGLATITYFCYKTYKEWKK